MKPVKLACNVVTNIEIMLLPLKLSSSEETVSPPQALPAQTIPLSPLPDQALPALLAQALPAVSTEALPAISPEALPPEVLPSLPVVSSTAICLLQDRRLYQVPALRPLPLRHLPAQVSQTQSHPRPLQRLIITITSHHRQHFQCTYIFTH